MITETLAAHNHKGELSHAYLFVGDRGAIVSEIKDFLRNIFSEDLVAIPDILEREFLMFGIADSHTLRDWQSRRAFLGKGKFIIASIPYITTEAQNALLKTIEEPASDVHFFFVTSLLDAMLDTVKSRCQIIVTKPTVDKESLERARQFIELEPADRIKILSYIIDAPEGGKALASDFLNSLEVLLSPRLERADDRLKAAQALEKILDIKKFLQWPTASVKLLMEYLSLIIY